MTTCDADAIPELISCFVPIRRLVADFGLETGMYNSTLQKKNMREILQSQLHVHVPEDDRWHWQPAFRSDRKQRAGGAYVTSRRLKVVAFPGRAGVHSSHYN